MCALAAFCAGARDKAPRREVPAPVPTHAIARGGVSRDPYIGAVAIDAASGAVLFSDSPDRPGYPASTTKMMTFLLVLEDIEAKRYTLRDVATASQRAASQIPSSAGLRAGQSMTVDDLLFALMVKSANDAAVVLAEKSAGSVEAFVERMNERAGRLGMANTRFASPNGLSPASGRPADFDISTAADLAKLARAVLARPEAVRYTSRASCTVTDGAGKPLTLRSHNPFLTNRKYKLDGVDGLKTGYTDKGGSSIALSAARSGRRVVVVILGSSSAKARNEAARRLLVDALGSFSMWERKGQTKKGKAK